MNNFKKNNRFGGGGFNKGGERPYGRSGGNDFGRKMEMHQAICADCKKSCEVPFKPNGMKPVYCKECFPKNGGQVSSGNDFQKKSFKPAYNSSPTYAPKPQYQNSDRKSDDLSKQLEMMNAKFDKLISLTETLVLKVEFKPAFVAVPKSEKSAKPEKTASKKLVGKKK